MMNRLSKYLYSLSLLCSASLTLVAQHSHEHQSKAPFHWCGSKPNKPSGDLRSLRALDFTSKSIPNDNKLRIYRLILPVDYSAYTQLFNRNRDEVIKWRRASVEYLNRVYQRDVGIKFELVAADKFIMTTKASEKFPNKPAAEIVATGTQTMDNLNNSNSPVIYDLGVWLTLPTQEERDNGLGGLASSGVMHGYYAGSDPCGAMVALKDHYVLAHEIGHMFGADHTFYHGGNMDDSSTATEANLGNSIMSYGGSKPDYFALASICQMREHISQPGYTVQGYPQYNYPRVINYNNQAPKLDKTKYKTSYTVPLGSYFHIEMKATDANNHKLLYAVHLSKQPKYNAIPASNHAAHPNFYTAPFREGSPTPFQPILLPNNTDYLENGYGQRVNTRFFKGDYRLWLGVRDASDDANFKVLYDTHQLGVRIEEGTPFDILPESNIKAEYESGETIDLKWSVDKNIFPSGSKIRILLSDDYGQTFKHTLLAETDNDGAETITLPKLNIGKTDNPKARTQVGKGVIRIEVIDHIVFADSHIGGKNRTQENQRYSFTLHEEPDEVAPVPTPRPIDSNSGDNRVQPKTPTDYMPGTAQGDSSVEHRITAQVTAGAGSIEFIRLAHNVVRVTPRPASGNRLKSLKVTIGDKEQDITATRSFILTGNASLEALFEANSDSPSLLVYPSPAVDYINITSKQANTPIYITTLSGVRQLLGRTDSEGTARCYVGGYPTGSYVLSLGSANQTIQIQ